MSYRKFIEKWKRSFRKRFSSQNQANYYKKKLLGIPDPKIFDVGAHVGNTAAAYLKVFPHAEIYCFEPYLTSYKLLESKFKRVDNVITINEALSSEISEKTMFVNKSNDTNSFLEFSGNANEIWQNNNQFQTNEKCKVACNTLDNFCASKRIEQIDLLKIDCQGSEKFVLEGARKLLSYTKLVYIETNFVEVYKNCTKPSEIFSIIESHGLEFFNLFDSVNRSGQIIQSDMLFVSSNFMNENRYKLRHLL